MLHSNPAVRPRLTLAAVPKSPELSLDDGCTYTKPLPNWEADFESLVERFDYPDLPDTTKSEQELSNYEERYIKRRSISRAFGKSALALTLTLALPVSAYAADVRMNIAESANAQPTIRVVNEASSETGADKATIFYHGFNTVGASDLVRSLGKGASQAFKGEQWSIQYNNAPINAELIGEVAKNKIHESNTQAVDIISYSMGDITALKNSFELIDSNSADVETITILSGPADYDGLSEKTRDELELAKNLAWIPGIEYSTIGRYVAEMYFYKDDIEKNPANAITGINNRFMSGAVTTNNFLASQIYDISDANAGAIIKNVSDLKFRPIINYVKIKHGNDTVVDNDYSAEKICEYANEKGLICNIFEVDSRHGLYWKTPEAYDKVFAEIAQTVKPQVAEERERLTLARLSNSRMHHQFTIEAPEY